MLGSRQHARSSGCPVLGVRCLHVFPENCMRLGQHSDGFPLGNWIENWAQFGLILGNLIQFGPATVVI